ncbi:MAG: SUMF1/EgtB/PvdO family nonheme iron enzyme [Bacteroidia bacterium]
MMNRWITTLLLGIGVAFFTGCGLNGGSGDLTGVQGRSPWFHPQPYGTVYIPTGSFHMGLSDQDIMSTITARQKQVTVQAFYMDDTEISNNEYRQFVYYVRDSIAAKTMGGEYLINEGEENERIDWRETNRIDYSDPDIADMLYDMFYQGNDRVIKTNLFDTRKLIFSWTWFDIQEAAKRKYLENPRPRNEFQIEEEIPVYPDTLAFVRDFTYSFNEPMAQAYFWHPAYDNYPVVGVSWKQANAFNAWRTAYLNSYYEGGGEPIVNPFRLPTEAEWEYAARGNRELSQYPWGGPYVRNSKGCFLANFKPLRGNYIEDGGLYPVKVLSYFPNDYGLYCMAGNVSEWTSSAYDESIYSTIDDLNPDFRYDAEDTDPDALKRKVIRGGSWKDIAFYIQVGSRSHEFQDTAKSYVGFRSVMTYMGRSNKDK